LLKALSIKWVLGATEQKNGDDFAKWPNLSVLFSIQFWRPLRENAR
jgi:hypothetical protein